MNLPTTDFGVVLVTASCQSEAEMIAIALIESGVAACVNILPVQSIYRWQGEIERAEEWQLLIKADLQQFTKLETQIKAIHSYEVPEIIALPIIKGSTDYLDWLRSPLQHIAT